MKKTTYMMIALFFLGLVAFSMLISYNVTKADRNERMEYENRPVIGVMPEMTDTLPEFSEVKFYGNDDVSSLGIGGFKGFAILESDCVKRPELVAPADWMPYIKRDVEDGVLSVSIDRDSIVKGCLSPDGSFSKDRHYKVKADSSIIATIRVPRGKLSSVNSSLKGVTIYLDSLRAGSLRTDICHRIVLNNSHFDTLENKSTKIRELKLNGSTVGMLKMGAKRKGFTINCVDSVSAVGSYSFESGDSKNGMKISF